MRDLLGEREALRVDAFICLSRIETGLRRFIEVEAPQRIGGKWRKGLPSDVQDRLGARSLDVLYLADLRKILARYWSDLGPIKDRLQRGEVLTHLEGLDVVRNDIAHSRYIQAGSLAKVQAAYHLLEPVLIEYLIEEPEHAAVDFAAALIELQGAVLREQALPASALRVIERESTAGDVVDAIRQYDRLVRQPGHSQSLLKDLRDQALQAISAMPGDVTGDRRG